MRISDFQNKNKQKTKQNQKKILDQTSNLNKKASRIRRKSKLFDLS